MKFRVDSVYIENRKEFKNRVKSVSEELNCRFINDVCWVEYKKPYLIDDAELVKMSKIKKDFFSMLVEYRHWQIKQ